MTQVLPPRAQRSINKLASVMGEGVLALDIQVFDDKVQPDMPPAFTNDSAIFVAKSIIDHEPQNLAVYVGHEILHHVVGDPLPRSTFNGRLVNVAEDLVINYLLKAVYRLDVRKVLQTGVYDAKLGKKPVMEVCGQLAKKLPGAIGCGCRMQSVTYPKLYDLAQRIKTHLASHPVAQGLKLSDSRQIVVMEKAEDEALYEQLKAEFWKFGRQKAVNIDLDLLVRALFGRLYARTVRYDIRKDMPYLSHAHGIALSIAVSKLRPLTVGDAGAALSFAFHITKHLLHYGSPDWKHEIISRQRERITKLKAKVKERRVYSKRERRAFKKSIERARIKIAKSEAETNIINVVQANERMPVKPRSNKTGSAFAEALTIREDHLPRFKRNDVAHFAKRVAAKNVRALKDLYLIRDRLEQYVAPTKSSKVKSVLEDDIPGLDLNDQLEQTERQVLPQIGRRRPRPTQEQLDKAAEQAEKDREKQLKRRATQDRKLAAAEKREDRQAVRDAKAERKERIAEGDNPKKIEKDLAEKEAKRLAEREELHKRLQAARDAEDKLYEQADSDDEEDEDSGSESPSGGDSAGGEDSVRARIIAGEDEYDDLDTGDEDTELQGDGTSEPGGGGQGSGQAPLPTKASLSMQTLDLIGRDPKMLRKILIEADLFAEKLAQVSRAKIDPNTQVDRTYTFGDEVARADTSALVKLANDSMRMSFFADVANHALLQHTGTNPRRGSIIICLDCSGSMIGEPFIIAAGFTLAMFKVMSETKRGAALIKFSTNVDGMYVVDERTPVDMMQLLEAILSPSWGGTEFDAALEQATMLQEAFSWPNTQCLLVTDGGGWISKPVVDAAQANMKVASVLVGYGKKAIPNIADNRVVRSLEDLRRGLLTVAHSVL